ncbi:hypothetical protein G7Y79_00032g067110 [Physcia stellaris]|nr:hypothetical protein G7Y79_00032g067110 [Physcia stellaris]
MTPTSIQLSLVLSLLRVCSAYDQAYFATRATDWECDGLPFGCSPPQICVHDGLLNKDYCCGAGSSEAVCWTGSTECASNNQPSSSQIGCGAGTDGFCCLQKREECTQTTGQVNICWATAVNPFANVTIDQINATYSSLSSASPRATTLTVATEGLLAISTSASVSAATSTSLTSSSVPAAAAISPTSPSLTPTSRPSTTSSPRSSSISGGAIAGIVIGVVGGLGLIAAGAFFFWKKAKKGSHSNAHNGSNGYRQEISGADATGVAHEKYVAQAVPRAELYHPPAEMAADAALVEVPGSEPPRPGSSRQEDLPGSRRPQSTPPNLFRQNGHGRLQKEIVLGKQGKARLEQNFGGIDSQMIKMTEDWSRAPTPEIVIDTDLSPPTESSRDLSVGMMSEEYRHLIVPFAKELGEVVTKKPRWVIEVQHRDAGEVASSEEDEERGEGSVSPTLGKRS